MIDLDLVKDYFAMLSGLELAEVAKFSTILSISARDVEGRLKKGIDEEGNKEKLAIATAGVSFYEYCLLKMGGNGGTAVKIGDVTVNEDSKQTIAAAKELMKQYLNSIKDLLEVENFVFKRV